jgi:hypothetical protein
MIMKKIFLLLFVAPFALSAQITESDMPSAGDTMRFSVAASAPAIEAGPGGTGTTWDFSDLQSASQFVDEFVSVSSTPFTYVAVFGLPFSGSYCDMARLDNSAFQIPEIPLINLTVEDVYNFYKSESDAFEQRGFGASLNGFPIPIAYSTGDVLVPLPLNPSTVQSGAYSFNANIPTIGYYGRDAVRNNSVDGTGTLVLPMGSYETIRLRSELVYTDSVALDALGFGFQLPELTEIRYKWMAPGYGWPLLEITTLTDPFLGMETTSRVVYRDAIQTPDPEGISKLNLDSRLVVYPNPASEVLMLNFNLYAPVKGTISVMNAMGQELRTISREFIAGNNLEVIPLSGMQLSAGNYFIKISNENGQFDLKPFIVSNP